MRRILQLSRRIFQKGSESNMNMAMHEGRAS